MKYARTGRFIISINSLKNPTAGIVHVIVVVLCVLSIKSIYWVVTPATCATSCFCCALSVFICFSSSIA